MCRVQNPTVKVTSGYLGLVVPVALELSYIHNQKSLYSLERSGGQEKKIRTEQLDELPAPLRLAQAVAAFLQYIS